MKFTITDDERDTLAACLDYCCVELDHRLNVSLNTTDGFAVRLVRRKVARLRTKLFPQPAAK